MAAKTKTHEITILNRSGTFLALLNRFSREKEEYDFEGLAALRALLSNEKARILHIIKSKSPNSIYQLAKLLGRDFKSVSDDIKLLERFGFIELTAEKSKGRSRLKPSVIIDTLHLEIKLT